MVLVAEKLKPWLLMVFSKCKAFYATIVSISKLSFMIFNFLLFHDHAIAYLFSMTVVSSWSHILLVKKNWPFSQFSIICLFFLLYHSLSCSPSYVPSSVFLATQAKSRWLLCLWKPRKEQMLWKTSFTARVTAAPASMEIDPRETEKKLCTSSGLDAALSWWLQRWVIFTLTLPFSFPHSTIMCF